MYDIFDLQCASPPILSQEIKAVIGKNLLRDIRSQICDIIDILTSKNKFTSEFEILSNIFYKFRNQWRREKCLRFLKQAINAVDKFKRMDFVKTLETFNDLVPSRFSIINKEKLFLPTSSVFLYLFAKLLTACIVIHKAILYCILSAIEIEKQMELQLFLSYMTFSLAALSVVKNNLEDLKIKIFVLYETLLQCFVSIYPTIQFPFSLEINLWYSALFSNSSELINKDENKHKALIDLYEAAGGQNNISSIKNNHINLKTKINSCRQNTFFEKKKKIELVNKVKNILDSNLNNLLNEDQGQILKNINIEFLNDCENLNCNQNIYNEIDDKQKSVEINSIVNKGKFISDQNQFLPLIFKKNEIDIFIKKCVSTSRSSADVERMFHKLLKRHNDKQFTGLLISFRNFKKIHEIEKKSKITDNKIFIKLALKIVRNFLNKNK